MICLIELVKVCIVGGWRWTAAHYLGPEDFAKKVETKCRHSSLLYILFWYEDMRRIVFLIFFLIFLNFNRPTEPLVT